MTLTQVEKNAANLVGFALLLVIAIALCSWFWTIVGGSWWRMFGAMMLANSSAGLARWAFACLADMKPVA